MISKTNSLEPPTLCRDPATPCYCMAINWSSSISILSRLMHFLRVWSYAPGDWVRYVPHSSVNHFCSAATWTICWKKPTNEASPGQSSQFIQELGSIIGYGAILNTCDFVIKVSSKSAHISIFAGDHVLLIRRQATVPFRWLFLAVLLHTYYTFRLECRLRVFPPLGRFDRWTSQWITQGHHVTRAEDGRAAQNRSRHLARHDYKGNEQIWFFSRKSVSDAPRRLWLHRLIVSVRESLNSQGHYVRLTKSALRWTPLYSRWDLNMDHFQSVSDSS